MYKNYIISYPSIKDSVDQRQFKDKIVLKSLISELNSISESPPKPVTYSLYLNCLDNLDSVNLYYFHLKSNKYYEGNEAKLMIKTRLDKMKDNLKQYKSRIKQQCIKEV